MTWLWLTVLGLAAIAALAAALSLYGASRWGSVTRELRARLDAGREARPPARFDLRELEGLPPPVQRYFRRALSDGQPLVAAADLEQAGTFNMSETAEAWKPFSSRQRVITRSPGFVWDGTIVLFPGVPVRVHDAYVAGEGILHATILGLIDLADVRGTGGAAEAELMRYVAEAAWYPSALLPSQGITWEGVDEHSARATLKDRGLSVTLLYRFGGDALIASVRAEARGRLVAGKVVPTPWEARCSHYETRNGMRLPTDGEAGWILPRGFVPYWRGHLTRLEFEFAK